MSVPDPLPSQARVEWELLKLLHLSGSLTTQVAYSALADRFALTAEQRARRIAGDRTENAWQNRCRWARDRLVQQGLLDPRRRGRWLLTEAGKQEAGPRGDFQTWVSAYSLEELGL